MRKAFLLVPGILLLLVGVAVPLLTVPVVFILPPKYAATARIDPGVTEPSAQGTEIVKIQSGAVLSQVISNLNLSAKWGEKYREGALPLSVTEAILRRDLSVRLQRGTSLVEIKVESDSPEEAASIANQIVEVYQASPFSSRGADRKSAIQIVDKAQPAFRPTRPNKPRAITIAAGMGILMAAIGVALMVAARLQKKPVEPR